MQQQQSIEANRTVQNAGLGAGVGLLSMTGSSADDIRQMRDERAGHVEKVLASVRASGRRQSRMKPRGRR